MSKYKECLKSEPIAAYGLSNNFGVLIYEIDEAEERVLIADKAGSRLSGFRKNKIHYDLKGEPYFNHFGKKIYFNECLRIV